MLWNCTVAYPPLACAPELDVTTTSHSMPGSAALGTSPVSKSMYVLGPGTRTEVHVPEPFARYLKSEYAMVSVPLMGFSAVTFQEKRW